MALPSYTTDLVTIATGNLAVDAGTWDESTDAGWDTGGTMVDDANLYYNNTECISAQMTKDSSGTGAAGPATIFYNHTASFTIPADGAALIHHLWAAPPALNTINDAVSAGINVCAGSSLGDFYAWRASGSDSSPAPRGGWANYAINPAIGSPDHTVGTAPTVYSMIGVGVSATAQARGNPNACNAVRYGRCEAIYTGGELGGYATFAGFGAVDNVFTNRWNLLEPTGTSSFKQQGLCSLGTAVAPVDFRDSNKSLEIRDTINVTSAFSKFEVNNAASNIEWTAINITALGINSKGSFTAVDNASVSKINCTFTDMDFFTYQSNSSLTNTTFRRCGLVAVGGGLLSGCNFDKATGTLSTTVANLGELDVCTFDSTGSNHATELTSIGAGSMTSSSKFTNYDAGAVGSPVTPTSTGNEAIFVNVASGTLSIAVAAGATIPSIRSAGAIVNVTSGGVSIDVNVIDQAELPIASALVYIDENLGVVGSITNTSTDANGDIVQASYTGAVLTATLRVRKYGYRPYKATLSLAVDTDTSVTLITDPQQS